MNRIDTTDPSTQHLSAIERFVVLAAAMPAAMSFTTMTPVLHKMQEALASGPDDALLVRLALTVVGISMVLGSPLAGWIIDRIGVRSVLVVSVLAWTGLGCLGYWIHDLHLLIVMRFFEGIAATSVVVVGTALVGEIPDEVARAKLVGYEIMLANGSAIVTLILAGYLGDIDWRYAFLLHLIELPVLISAFLLQRSKLTSRAPKAAAAPGFWRACPYGLIALGFMTGFLTFGCVTYMPFRFHEIGIEKSTLIGMAFTCMNIATGSAAGLFGYARKRMSAKTAFKYSFAIATVGAVLAATLTNYYLIIGGLVVFGIGVGSFVPNLFSIASGTAVAHRGRVTGMVQGIRSGAALIGAIIFEPIMRLGGASGVMLTLAALALAGAVGFAISEARDPKSLANDNLVTEG